MSQAGDFVDYYALLGVAETANGAAIEKAIHEIQRKWRSRQNSPDARRRSEAEAMMRLVEAAEVALTDRKRRSVYDRQRRSLQGSAVMVRENMPRVERRPQPGSESNYRQRGGAATNYAASNPWVKQARDLFSRGAFEAARLAASRAVQVHPADPESWSMLGQTLTQLGRYVEAEMPLAEAVALAPTAANRVDLAKCRMRLGEYGMAFESLSAAYRREPGSERIRDTMILCYVGAGSPELALPIAESLANEFPHHRHYQRQLAWVLYKMTVAELTETSPGLYLITSPFQAEAVRTNLDRAWKLHFDDTYLKAEIQKWYQLGEASTTRKFTRPGSWLAWTAALVAGLLFLISSIPWFGLLYLAGFAVVFFITRYRPQWQLNRRECEATQVTRWGT